MSITAQAIEKNRITFVVLLVIIFGGLGAYFTLPRAEDPEFLIRTAQVTTYFPGASPERVEQLVTDKIEKKIQEIPELDFVSSQSATSVSSILVNIKEEYRNMRPIWDNLRRKVESVRNELPDGITGPIVNDEFGDVFGINIALTGEGYEYSELKDIADDVRDEFLRLNDVAKVNIYGAQDERVFIEYNNARLAEFGLSPIQLQQILNSRNIIIPGGSVDTDHEKIALEPSGNFESIEDIKQTIIKIPGRSQLVYLEDIADISRGYIDPPSHVVHASGISGLVLAISMKKGGNIIDLGEQVTSVLNRVKSIYPIGVEFDVVTFQPDIVQESIKDFTGSLLQAIAIVIVVMLLFLGIRTGLIVSSLIPSAMIMTLLIMSFFNIGLDKMSLASLIIALGMLVDNAIVMTESIMVSMQSGRSAKDAAVESANELKIPLLTSSLTTAVAFLPIFLAESSTGEYTAPLFKVVTITLLSSWLLSITIVPLICVTFLKVKKATTESFNSTFYTYYRKFLLFVVKKKAVSLGAVFVVFVVSMMAFGLVPVRFFPPSDRPLYTAEFEFPAGTNISYNEETVQKIEQYLRDSLMVTAEKEKGLVNWATFIGQGAPKFALSYNPERRSPDYTIMIGNGTDRTTTDSLIHEIDRYIFENYPDIQLTIRPLDLGPPVTNPVEIRLSGKETDYLFTLVDSLKYKLASIEGTKNIADNWGMKRKKLLVTINQPRARRAGVTSQDIAISLQTNLAGLVTTEYREGDNVIPVVLRSVAAERNDLGKIETMNVFAQATGKSVPLSQVADVKIVWEPNEILRRNRLKTVAVSSAVAEGVTPTDVNNQIIPWLNEQAENWPIGYSWELGGEAESSGKANESINEKLPIAGFLITILLVGQFNSIRRPIIILLTIPLGLIGVVIGLLVANSYMGFMTFLGVISLAGIVINNAIVLIDRIRIEIDENNLTPQMAIIESAQRRLRPILLTTLTTIGGLLPLWFGGDPMFQPMAIAIIFGLMFATILTLGVVPVLYSLFFKVSFKDFTYSN